MVDMSPEAITDRLRLMDELWLLSVKLMNSKITPHVQLTIIGEGATSNCESDEDKNQDLQPPASHVRNR